MPFTIELEDSHLYDVNDAPVFPIGSRGGTADGRLFRFAKDDGTGILPGLLCQCKAEDNTNDNMVVAVSAAATDGRVLLTSGDTWTKDQLLDGLLTCEVNTATTGGCGWNIGANDAAVSAQNFYVYLKPSVTFGKAITAGTDSVYCRQNLWRDVIVYPTTSTGVAVGVTMTKITASGDPYSWLCTRGLCAVSMDNDGSDITVGESLCPDGTVGGSVENVTGGVEEQVIGATVAVQGQTDQEMIPVFLTIE